MPSESRQALAMPPAEAERNLARAANSALASTPPGAPPKPAAPKSSAPGAGSPLARKVRPSGLVVSKQWVLPPRPKPGRKPKPKPESGARDTRADSRAARPADRRGRPERSLRNDTLQNDSRHDRHGSPQNDSRYHHPPESTQTAIDNGNADNGNAHNGNALNDNTRNHNARSNSHSEHSHSEYGHNEASPGTRSPSDNPGKRSPSDNPVKDEDDESCGLCSREDCMCETIGIKPSEKRPFLPSLEMILNTVDIKMDAVPLKRPAPAPSAAPRTKFARANEPPLQPVQPAPQLTVPSPLEGLQYGPDGCGFCTENTPCACAESAGATPPVPMVPVLTGPPLLPPPLAAPAPLGASPPAVGSPGFALGRDEDYGCATCQKDAMSMLFCVSLGSARPLAPEAVAIPCHLAVKTLQKHPRFAACDLGRLIRQLEVRTKQVGVQSINRVLQELERGEFS